MARKFPCPCCKGQGSEHEIVIPETGEGPDYECGYCEGEGMIEIDGPLHRRIKQFQKEVELSRMAASK